MENQSQTLEGVVVFLPAHEGSKSEGVYPFLYQGREKPVIKLVLKGDNPFENKGLLGYDGKNVKVIGVFSRTGTFVVESVAADIPAAVDPGVPKETPEDSGDESNEQLNK